MVESTEPPVADTEMQHLQRRVMRLLLQHHKHLFCGQFQYFYVEGALPHMPLLQRYDRFLKLQMLSDELLDDILPRIRRQLSLKTSRARLREEAPTRGDIDWQRTIEHNWSIAPGAPATGFETRLRQYTMDTPENLLTVAILLAFRQELQQILKESLEDEALNIEEKQVFTSADERAERELAASYARALIEQARKVDIFMLTQQVAASLRAGPNPYRNLLAWWQHFIQFRVGRAAGEHTLSLVSKRGDQQNNTWLYELWVVLECIHLLHTEGCVQPADLIIEHGLLRCSFTWQQRRFRLLYRHQPDIATNVEAGWEQESLAGPRYVIERETPLEIATQGELIWREPPVIFEAKYDSGGGDPTNKHDSIKKLLGEMTLLDSPVGVFLSPYLPEFPGEQQIAHIVKRSGKQYMRDISQQIHIYHLEPTMPLPSLQMRLRSMLDLAAQSLPERPLPACQGCLIDTDNVNASRSILPVYTILCPKPHIGPDVFDLVNAETDCLKNPRVCHVMGQSIMPPFVARIMTQEQLVTHSSTLRQHSDTLLRKAEKEGDEAQAEGLRKHIFVGVGHAIEQYVRLFCDTRNIEGHFERWVFGKYWKQDSRCLAETTRHSLVSGEVVWQHFQGTAVEDWAAPAIEFCRALEFELKRRFYDPQERKYKLGQAGFTLGTISYAYTNRQAKPDAKTNWDLFVARVIDSKSDIHEFERLVQWMLTEKIREKRNALAHGETLSKATALALHEFVLGDREKIGILPWLTRHVEPD
jgi:hypothetical protein